MFRYFISYSHSKGFGNREVRYPKHIKGIEDVKAVARLIEQDAGYAPYEVVILNYNIF